MTISAALVLFSVIWFMTLFIVLPIKLVTQGDEGEIVPGTHAGSPARLHLKKRMWITTGIAVVLWIIIAGVILSGAVTLRDIDLFTRFGPDAR